MECSVAALPLTLCEVHANYLERELFRLVVHLFDSLANAYIAAFSIVPSHFKSTLLETSHRLSPEDLNTAYIA